MADIAFVFHWPPAAMNDLSVPELMAWRDRAARRHDPEGKSRGS